MNANKDSPAWSVQVSHRRRSRTGRCNCVGATALIWRETSGRPADEDHRLAFGPNDWDETLPGSWEWASSG